MSQDFRRNETHNKSSDEDPDTSQELPSKPSAKVARFEEGVTSPTEPDMPPFSRTETMETDSRSVSPSIADTEDEDDFYDWSGEEDLVDEEAKFERSMGVGKDQRWGFRK